MHFRVGSKSPVTFKTKLCVTTVNNTFQPLTIFVTESSTLDFAKAWIEYWIMITKILKYQGGISYDLEKIWKTHPPKYLENLNRLN